MCSKQEHGGERVQSLERAADRARQAFLKLGHARRAFVEAWQSASLKERKIALEHDSDDDLADDMVFDYFAERFDIC
jgi:hypothetical protein